MLQVVQNWCLANIIPFEAVVLFLGGLTGAIVLYMFDNIYLNLPCVRKKRMKKFEEQAMLEAFKQTIKK